MKYVIEHDGVLSGPFDTPEQAAEFAHNHYAIPWTLRALHIVPRQLDLGED